MTVPRPRQYVLSEDALILSPRALVRLRIALQVQLAKLGDIEQRDHIAPHDIAGLDVSPAATTAKNASRSMPGGGS
ncbi:MAG: hypothetical protein ACREV4_15610 [Gammaproteobacteria bacterium]